MKTELKATGKKRVFVKERTRRKHHENNIDALLSPCGSARLIPCRRLSSGTIKGRDVVRAIPLPGPCQENCDAHHRTQPKACLVDASRKLAGFLI